MSKFYKVLKQNIYREQEYLEKYKVDALTAQAVRFQASKIHFVKFVASGSSSDQPR